ncbi:ABC transporter substrate-binding protein [Aureimonas fodinaquatilis]|uniref:ABC transporter substrate-binding protein n=1 Tax=Aureimonas fodinaquatilis TaxID=2565783 RepID=A0A5B0DZ39_9HYPH|nr:ABC transporter substrate-binding protein [Aureimonas fodinaquatilis]KAA0972074.1 ABC transporter substrate-binding protein [Aureimonas fodinaquatilis]
MKKLTLCALGGLIASALVSTASARDLTVVSWGGNYQDAQREIYFKPFAEKTGKPVLEESWDGGYGVIAAKMETRPANWDVVQVEAEELALGCADGLYETVDWNALGGEDKFIPSAVNECGVGAIVWTTGLGYDADKLTTAPQSWADFWDTEKFPGKRGLRRGPKYALEFALMADGVPAKDVYEVLATDEGVDRAFNKLGEIKGDIVWWESGAQPVQLLASGEVVMATAYNGRLSGINKTEGRNLQIVWPGSIYAVDSWVVLKDSPNKDEAFDFIKFASEPENQSKLPEYIAYGLPNIAAGEMLSAEAAAELPTAPQNLEGAITLDTEFWIDNIEELNTRFNAWLAQ